MRGKSCCFTGHRVIVEENYYRVLFLLRQTVEKKIKEGYTDFYAGGAMGFDTLAALTVLRMKMVYPDIRLHLILPCISQPDKWKAEDIRVYQRIKEESDSAEYVSFEYTPYCMNQRNRALVDRADYCIAYCTQTSGGTAYTIGYAMDTGVEVENLAHGVKNI